MLFAALYALVVGTLMLIVWIALLVTGQVPDLPAQLPSLIFHWVAELLTAVALILAGAGVLRKRTWHMWGYPLAMGMLVYTLINRPGYYAQRGEWAMVGMFGVLGLLWIIAMAVYLSRRAQP